MRLAVVLCAVISAVVLAAPASGSELIQDSNAQLLSLRVNGKGEALVTYRRADGSVRHVLAWGAINARAPSEEVPQVRFRWDYAGGWGKYHNGKYWQTFRKGLRAVRRPCAADAVAACKAPNGSYWTVQAWQRRLPLLGFDPWLPAQSGWELHLAHFAGELPKLEVYANWTYNGRGRGCSAATRTSASQSSASVRTPRACRRTGTAGISTSTPSTQRTGPAGSASRGF